MVAAMRGGVGVLLAVGGLAPLLLGCTIMNGSGTPEQETRAVDTSGVKELVVCCGFEVQAALGTSEDVTVETDDNLLDEVVVHVVEDRMELRWRDDQVIYSPSHGVRFELELPELVRLETSGGSTVDFGPVEGHAITVDQSGGGSTHFDAIRATSLIVGTSGGGHFEAPELTVETLRLLSSGGGQTELGGTSPEFFADVSGGGSLLAGQLTTERTELFLSGGGSADLHVTESLTGEASGGSRVTLQGGAEVELDLSGGSSVDED